MSNPPSIPEDPNEPDNSVDDSGSNVPQEQAPPQKPKPKASQSAASGLLINGMTIPDMIVNEIKNNQDFKRSLLEAIFSQDKEKT